MLPKRVVLLGDGVTTLSAAWCLRRHPISLVFLPGEAPLARYSRYVKKAVGLPDSSPARVLAALKELRSRHGELLLFPCSDTWLEILAANLEPARRCGRVLPRDPADLRMTVDKIEFARRLEQAGLPAPRILSFDVRPEWRPPAYPVVIKPSSTFSLELRRGVKAFLLREEKQWDDIAASLPALGTFLAQEYVEGASISVCFCTAEDSSLAAAYATEKVHYKAMSTGTRVRTLRSPEAIELAREFAARTGFVGFGELEMIAGPRGLVLLELNARPWHQAILSEAVGVPVLEAAVRLMRDEPTAGMERNGNGAGEAEWIAWDADLLFRRKAGWPAREAGPARRMYAISPLRDPLPALAYYLTRSRLGPGRFLGRLPRFAQP